MKRVFAGMGGGGRGTHKHGEQRYFFEAPFSSSLLPV
jgi:hypothetical protein